MPVSVSKKDGKFQVRTPGGVKAKGTTKSKALAQKRLLNAIENDPDFVPRARREAAKRIIKTRRR